MMDMNKDVLFYYSQSSNIEEDKIILEPFEYNSHCNKKWSKLVIACDHWLKIPYNKLEQIKDIVRILNNAYTLFDDIQDDTRLREGNPIAHSVYGLSHTLNAANYGQLISFKKLINLHPDAIKIVIEELLEYSRGQGMYIYWKTNFICPTEEDYKFIGIRTCSCLFKTVIRLMQLFSTCEKDFSSLISILAMYDRIQDDYCDLYIEKDPDDKSDCSDDLTEGNFTFPIIHALTNNPNDKEIKNILKQRTKNIDLKRRCVELLENYGSLKYTRNVLEELNKKVRTEIEHLGGNPILMKIVDEISKTHLSELLN